MFISSSTIDPYDTLRPNTLYLYVTFFPSFVLPSRVHLCGAMHLLLRYCPEQMASITAPILGQSCSSLLVLLLTCRDKNFRSALAILRNLAAFFLIAIRFFFMRTFPSSLLILMVLTPTRHSGSESESDTISPLIAQAILSCCTEEAMKAR